MELCRQPQPFRRPMTRRSEKMITWVEPDLKRAVEAAASADERTVSDWLRLVVRRITANNPAKPPLEMERKITHATRALAGKNNS